MTPNDSDNPSIPTASVEGAIENQPTGAVSSSADAVSASNDEATSAERAAEATRRRLLIGSQRDPAANRARPKRDWEPVVEKSEEPAQKKSPHAPREQDDEASEVALPSGPKKPMLVTPLVAEAAEMGRGPKTPRAEAPTVTPKPSIRAKDVEIENELEHLMSGASMDDLLGGGKSEQTLLELDSVQTGRVVAVRRDDIFVEFAGRAQGILSARLLDVPLTPGMEVQVVVQRLNPEDGLYELSLPNRSVQVDDWSDLVEGALIDVRVTGHNAGGLECEINHIRGFIPVSQIALYRVEDLAQFVDQKFTCLISESNPDRRNLVLSRRAVLEREKEQAKVQMLSTLQPGQIFDGTVRKLMDFGAFVELGNGVDGLIHISQLAWGRVKHPSDVLHEGQAVRVRVQKVDPETGKISLGYRDLMESPWAMASHKYPTQSVVRGTVTKLMDFGAFVELEPGVEGLVHVSELSHKRVWRPSDVVKEGDPVEVTVLSIDTEAQRISLSMKACSASPEPVKKEDDAEAAAPVTSKKSNKPTGPLLGGLGKRTGERFGLKW